MKSKKIRQDLQVMDYIPSDGVIDENFILKLFGLEHDDIRSISCIHKADGIYIDVTLNKKTHRCPRCTAPTSRVHDYRIKKITHSILHNVNCYINYHVRRYRCPACGKTFVESNPFTIGQSRISVTTVYNVLTSLRDYTNSFRSVADTFNLSVAAVQSIFDEHVRVPRKQLPEYLLIDEVSAMKSGDSPYVCVLLDFVTQEIVDVLPGRKKDSLESYFMLMPVEERRKVRIVCSDCWKTYRIVAHHCFPNCRTACDEFHMIQIYTRIFRRIRIDIMNECKRKRDRLEEKLKTPTGREYTNPEWQKYDNQYYLLKKFNWLLVKRDDDAARKPGQHRRASSEILDPNRPKKMNKKIGRYLNWYDIRRLILEIDDDLAIAEYYYDRLRDFYHHTSYKEAPEALNKLIIDIQSSQNPKISAFAKNLKEWKQEIINSFIIVNKTGTHISTAKIESKNRGIQTLKLVSNGMTNFERMRNRIMYSLNRDVPFYLMPHTDDD